MILILKIIMIELYAIIYLKMVYKYLKVGKMSNIKTQKERMNLNMKIIYIIILQKLYKMLSEDIYLKIIIITIQI